MNQPSDYVRSDTPDPRSGMFTENIASSAPPVPHAHLDISLAWPYLGTNNSAIGLPSYNHNIGPEFSWKPDGSIQRQPHDSSSVFSNTLGMSHFKHKRSWQSSDDRFSDDPGPPRKQHINEEKVAQQFHSMSISADRKPVGFGFAASNQGAKNSSVNEMWTHFHQLEDKLDGFSDTEVDEGVDMTDIDLTSSSSEQSSRPPTLHVISPCLKATINSNPSLPQILVPKPCKEIVLWQPSGVDFIKKSIEVEDEPGLPRPSTPRTSKFGKRSSARGRLQTTNSSLLSVPDVRPNTPPPNTSTSPVSHDIPVCFVEDMDQCPDMDI